MGGTKLKVGHAGTLDPLASGVMIVCTGRATKKIDTLQAGVKEYVATLRLGATTPSFDLEHPSMPPIPRAISTAALVETTLKQFIGDIMQVPPAFSACKVGGRRAYEMARKGEEVPLKAKLLRLMRSNCSMPRSSARHPPSPFASFARKAPTSALWRATSASPSAAAHTSPRSAARKWAMCAWKIVIVSTISNNGSRSKRSKPNYLNKIPDAPLAFHRKGSPVAGNKTHTAA